MNRDLDPLQAITQIDAFSQLSLSTRKTLAKQLQACEYEAGEALSEPGNGCRHLFIIASGVVAMTANCDGKASGPQLLRANDAAGLSGLLDDHPPEHGLLARETVKAWRLSRAAFREVLEDVPDDQWRLMQFLARQLRSETGSMRPIRKEISETGLQLAFFDTKPYTEEVFRQHTPGCCKLNFFEARLTEQTARLAAGCQVVVPFVNDHLSKEVIALLKEGGTELIAMRCAGYNNVDLAAARKADISVVRVPAYSPYAVAEHAMALILTLNRKTHRAYNRVREHNFSLNGLVGFDLHGCTAGIVGVGKIGRVLARIMAGFGMKLLGYDTHQDPEFASEVGLDYVELDQLFASADVISLHAPLLDSTYHMVDERTIELMKPGVMLINTSRGALIDAPALIAGLKSGHVGFAGLDVYEEEEAYFFEDRSGEVMDDDVLARLMTFPNVLITSHQAFLTRNALQNIATTTYENILEYHQGKRFGELTNAVLPQRA